MSKIIVIVGPTAVGKTKLSIALAKKFDAQIINADAAAIYKNANIGTAKITEEEREGIKHYMIDVASLSENYTVRDFQYDGRKILNSLIEEKKNIIIVGGSGLYTKALLYDYKFTDEEETKDYSNLTNEQLKQKVDEIYSDNNIHMNNRKRLERFLSHYEVTGEIIKNNEGKDKPLYNFTLIGLTADKEELYKQINKRVDKMFEEGLLKEVNELKNYPKTKTLIGYKETIGYLDGKISFEEAKEEIKRNTRKFAKRQYTWYKHQFENINWFKTDYFEFDKTINNVIQFLLGDGNDEK